MHKLNIIDRSNDGVHRNQLRQFVLKQELAQKRVPKSVVDLKNMHFSRKGGLLGRVELTKTVRVTHFHLALPSGGCESAWRSHQFSDPTQFLQLQLPPVDALFIYQPRMARLRTPSSIARHHHSSRPTPSAVFKALSTMWQHSRIT